MAGGTRDLGIELRFKADSTEAKAAIHSISGLLGDLPQDARKASGGMSAAFNGFRADMNQAFTFSAGMLMADGLKSGTTAIKDFGAASISTFLDVEKVMVGVAKTTGLPQAEIEKLNTTLRNTAAAIGPISTKDLGQIAEVAGQLGIASEKIKAGNFEAARDAIAGFSETIGKAAIALPEFTGGASEVADATAKILNLYQLGAKSAEQVLSVGNALANTTASDARQLFSFLQGFTSANTLGILNEQAQAIGATFISLGQEPHDSATRFQAALTRLNQKGFEDAVTVIEKSKTAIQSLADIAGVQAETLTSQGAISKALVTAMNTDIVAAALVASTAIGELGTNTEKLDAATDIFGKVGSRVMMTMSDNVSMYTTNLATAKQATEAALTGVSSIQEEFTVAISTQGAKFDELKSKVSAVQEVIGKELVGALAGVTATDLSPMVSQFRTWVETSDEAKAIFTNLPIVIGGVAKAAAATARAIGATYLAIAGAGEILGDTIAHIDESLDAIPRKFTQIKTEIVATMGEIKDAITGGFDSAIDKASGALDNYTSVAKKVGVQNEVMTGWFQGLADKIVGVEDALEGHSLTPAMVRYGEAAIIAGDETLVFGDVLGNIGGKIFDMEGSLESLGGALGSLSDAFGLEGLGNFSSFIEDMPGQISEVKDALGGLKGGLGDILGGLKGLGDGDILGSITSLIGGLGGIGTAITALTMAWDIGQEVFGAISDVIGGLFEDTKSAGTVAAEAMQDFVRGMAGGEEMAAAMQQSFGDMTDAGFDFATFMTDTGTTLDQAFGGISENWQQGATSMDMFTQAVGRATGDMSKAPQVALQMMASFQDMGLSAEAAGAKMLEIAHASGMSTAEVEQLQAALSGVQGQLSGAGEEGASTTTVFDQAKTSAASLKGEVNSLGNELNHVSAQLSGTSEEGGTTTAMLDDANLSASDLCSKISALSGDMSTLTGQLSGTGMETSITSGLFGIAGASAGLLKSDTEALGGGLTALSTNLSASASNANSLTSAMTRAAAAAKNLDNELVGHSVVPSLGKLFDVSRKSAGALDHETGVLVGMTAATRDLDKAVKGVGHVGGTGPDILAMSENRAVRPAPGLLAPTTTIGQVVIQNTISGNYISPDMDLNRLTDEISYRLEPKIRQVLRRV